MPTIIRSSFRCIHLQFLTLNTILTMKVLPNNNQFIFSLLQPMSVHYSSSLLPPVGQLLGAGVDVTRPKIGLFSVLFQARGQTSQRVYLAAQLLSESVAAAAELYLPHRASEARAVRICDRWFDVMNSRCKSAVKPERCAFGVQPVIEEQQRDALISMEADTRHGESGTAPRRRTAKEAVAQTELKAAIPRRNNPELPIPTRPAVRRP